MVLLLGARRRKLALVVLAGLLLAGCKADSTSRDAVVTQPINSTIVLTSMDVRNSNNQTVDYGLPQSGITIAAVRLN